MTITSCLLALFLRLSCEKHMKGLEFLQVKERTAACAESAEAAGQLSPLSLALTLHKNLENFSEKERKKNRKISEKNQENKSRKIGGDLIFNLSSVSYLGKDQKPQAYLGEEDQLRPSSPLVHLGKLWSPCLSQYLIRTVDVRGRVKLEVSSPVHSALFKWNSSLVQASFKTNL
ncbi:hypothetical protein IGI04_035932 [Brassica rapa subsp. trilocularis]|uniref:Uncharacterized protein n=1 Tax=Brassica rapa subsp. trilocularis TaxID=1813537 RepID=A0ABQ7LDY5_BRACM|nr:hypothetical protein IGI04_035932 [Brassica rapa subsp. trilocularis]